MNSTTEMSEADELSVFFDNPDELSEDAEEDQEGQGEDTPPVEADADDDDGEDLDASEVEDDDEIDEGDEPEDDAEEAEEPEAEPLYTVKVDGVEKQVTLKDLQSGYSGQAHLQQRHESLKAQEQAMTQAAQQMQQAQQAVLQLYQQAEQQGFQAPPTPPDLSMMQTDPIGYMEQRAYYDQAQEHWNLQQQQMQQVQQAQHQQEQMLRQQHIAAQQEILAEKLPEFRENREAFQQKLVKGAKEFYDLPADAFENIADAYAIEILNDALAYRGLQAGKKAAKRPKQDARGVTRPTAKSAASQGNRRAKTAMERAKKTQSDDAWADVFLTPET